MYLIQGIFIGIFIYSLIITIATFYKDTSSYYMVEALDLVLAGPVMWIVIIPINVICMMKAKWEKTHPKEYKEKSKRYVEKVVSKIMKKYAKKNKYGTIYLDLHNYMMPGNPMNGVEGWDYLMVRTPKNERLNKKFSNLMWNQEKDTIEAIKKHCNLVTKKTMYLDDRDEFFIKQYMNIELVVPKEI